MSTKLFPPSLPPIPGKHSSLTRHVTSAYNLPHTDNWFPLPTAQAQDTQDSSLYPFFVLLMTLNCLHHHHHLHCHHHAVTVTTDETARVSPTNRKNVRTVKLTSGVIYAQREQTSTASWTSDCLCVPSSSMLEDGVTVSVPSPDEP